MNKVTQRLPAGVSRLGDVLPQLIARYGIQHGPDVEAIDRVWKMTAPEPFASITRAAGLKRGTLEIAVPHNAFVQELSFQQDALLAKIKTVLPNEKIKKIKFVVKQ
ncbi:MAG: DUF721 domain-containing protein [Planctomycetaceae bacterium]|jgi:hypothetical protein|nr:DUF721 domain-containing protein [Planctomycetaceae bacterium]